MKLRLLIPIFFVVCFASSSLATPNPPKISYETSGLSVTISWNSVPGATGYYLNYAPYPYTGPESIRWIDVGNQTSVSYYLWEGAAYYVAVEAYDNYSYSNYSNIELFTVPTYPMGPPDFEAVDTYFLDHEGSFTQPGSWVTEGFTVYRTTTFVFHFTSDSTVQAAIITPTQLSSFQNGYGFSGYAIQEGVAGIKTVTLNPGNYYVAVRNNSGNYEPNGYRYELDLGVSEGIQTQSGVFYFAGMFLPTATTYLDAGEILWHSFTIQEGFRYFIEGTNSGGGAVGAWIIPQSELANFKNNSTFNYFADYGGEKGNLPGLWELKLSPGTYYLAVKNNDSKGHALEYWGEAWGY